MSVNLEVISEFLKQGFLGALLLLALFALYRVAVKYDQLQEKRISEGKENFKLIEGLTQAIRDLTLAQRNRRN